LAFGVFLLLEAFGKGSKNRPSLGVFDAKDRLSLKENKENKDILKRKVG
jgi:hypothetical protein